MSTQLVLGYDSMAFRPPYGSKNGWPPFIWISMTTSSTPWASRARPLSAPTAERADRELMVMELYRRGALSRGKAAELLGMPLGDFLKRANALGIPYFNFTDEEFAAELAAGKR